MSPKIAGLDNTMTAVQRNVSIVHLVSNAVFQQKLYVHSEQSMMLIMQSVLSAQMFTFVYTHPLVPYLLLTDGAMAKTQQCQLLWIFSLTQIDYQPHIINGALIAIILIL